MIRKWIVVGMALVVAGCSGIRVGQDYDPATRFDALNMFQWATAAQEKTGDPRIDNPLRDSRIRAAVERVLADKGFVRSQGEAPAFLIRYQYILRQRVESDGTRGRVGFGIGSYGRHGGIAIGTGDTIREFDEGSLIIDFWDAGKNTLLWRGTGVQRYKTYTDPKKAQQDVDRVVETILEQFPPSTP